jgi:hypothetical protein
MLDSYPFAPRHSTAYGPERGAQLLLTLLILAVRILPYLS